MHRHAQKIGLDIFEFGDDIARERTTLKSSNLSAQPYRYLQRTDLHAALLQHHITAKCYIASHFNVFNPSRQGRSADWVRFPLVYRVGGSRARPLRYTYRFLKKKKNIVPHSPTQVYFLTPRTGTYQSYGIAVSTT